MNNSHILQLDQSDHNRPVETRIRIRIPKQYHQEPVISYLTSQLNLKVNIIAAFLGVNAKDDGWFDLQLCGSSQQIDSALIYLSDLDVEIWHEQKTPHHGW